MIYLITLIVAVVLAFICVKIFMKTHSDFIAFATGFSIVIIGTYIFTTLVILIVNPITVNAKIAELEAARMTFSNTSAEDWRDATSKMFILEKNAWLGGAKYYAEHPYFGVFWPSNVLTTDFINGEKR
jgi:hypothetical protein